MNSINPDNIGNLSKALQKKELNLYPKSPLDLKVQAAATRSFATKGINYPVKTATTYSFDSSKGVAKDQMVFSCQDALLEASLLKTHGEKNWKNYSSSKQMNLKKQLFESSKSVPTFTSEVFLDDSGPVKAPRLLQEQKGRLISYEIKTTPCPTSSLNGQRYLDENGKVVTLSGILDPSELQALEKKGELPLQHICIQGTGETVCYLGKTSDHEKTAEWMFLQESNRTKEGLASRKGSQEFAYVAFGEGPAAQKSQMTLKGENDAPYSVTLNPLKVEQTGSSFVISEQFRNDLENKISTLPDAEKNLAHRILQNLNQTASPSQELQKSALLILCRMLKIPTLVSTPKEAAFAKALYQMLDLNLVMPDKLDSVFPQKGEITEQSAVFEHLYTAHFQNSLEIAQKITHQNSFIHKNIETLDKVIMALMYSMIATIATLAVFFSAPLLLLVAGGVIGTCTLYKTAKVIHDVWKRQFIPLEKEYIPQNKVTDVTHINLLNQADSGALKKLEGALKEISIQENASSRQKLSEYINAFEKTPSPQNAKKICESPLFKTLAPSRKLLKQMQQDVYLYRHLESLYKESTHLMEAFEKNFSLLFSLSSLKNQVLLLGDDPLEKYNFLEKAFEKLSSESLARLQAFFVSQDMDTLETEDIHFLNEILRHFNTLSKEPLEKIKKNAALSSFNEFILNCATTVSINSEIPSLEEEKITLLMSIHKKALQELAEGSSFESLDEREKLSLNFIFSKLEPSFSILEEPALKLACTAFNTKMSVKERLALVPKPSLENIQNYFKNQTEDQLKRLPFLETQLLLKLMNASESAQLLKVIDDSFPLLEPSQKDLLNDVLNKEKQKTFFLQRVKTLSNETKNKLVKDFAKEEDSKSALFLHEESLKDFLENSYQMLFVKGDKVFSDNPNLKELLLAHIESKIPLKELQDALILLKIFPKLETDTIAVNDLNSEEKKAFLHLLSSYKILQKEASYQKSGLEKIFSNVKVRGFLDDLVKGQTQEDYKNLLAFVQKGEQFVGKVSPSQKKLLLTIANDPLFFKENRSTFSEKTKALLDACENSSLVLFKLPKLINYDNLEKIFSKLPKGSTSLYESSFANKDESQLSFNVEGIKIYKQLEADLPRQVIDSQTVILNNQSIEIQNPYVKWDRDFLKTAKGSIWIDTLKKYLLENQINISPEMLIEGFCQTNPARFIETLKKENLISSRKEFTFLTEVGALEFHSQVKKIGVFEDAENVPLAVQACGTQTARAVNAYYTLATKLSSGTSLLMPSQSYGSKRVYSSKDADSLEVSFDPKMELLQFCVGEKLPGSSEKPFVALDTKYTYSFHKEGAIWKDTLQIDPVIKHLFYDNPSSFQEISSESEESFNQQLSMK